MKRKLLILLVCILGFTGCAGNFRDIRVTSCELLELSPLGLTSVEVRMNLGLHNPAQDFTLTDISGTIKFGDSPYLLVKSKELSVKGKTDAVYPVELTGAIAKGVNPFVILTVLKKKDFSRLKADFTAHITLKNGIGKDIELKDLPLEGLVDKI